MTAADKPVLVLFATPQEARPFARLAQRHPEVAVRLTGVGAVNADAALARALGEFSPRLVISSGFAGGLNPSLLRGQALFDGGSGPAILDALAACGAHRGRFHTTNAVLTTPEEKARLWRLTGADAVDMESEIVSARCRAGGLPCVNLRVISDAADEGLPLDFNQLFGTDYRIDYAKLLPALAKSPAKLVRLLVFWRQAAAASRGLAQVLERFIVAWLGGRERDA
jgi:nucleoside phosphorylase